MQDRTNTMPTDSWDDASASHDALSNALWNGQGLSNVDADDAFAKTSANTTNVDDLQPATSQQPEEALTPETQIEKLKVNGKEIDFDFSDKARLKEELQKGLAAQQKLRQAKKIRQENERLKAQLQKSGSGNVDTFKKAQALLEKGQQEQALQTLLGRDQLESYLGSRLEEEIRYREADPATRAKIDAERQERARRLEDEERRLEIENLRRQLEEQQTSVTENQYASYFEGARSAYNLGKWIDDSSIATELNDSLQLAANNEIVTEQQRREYRQERGENVPDVGEAEIRKIYHKHAKRLLSFYKKSAEKVADQRIEQQAQNARQAAQVASQKNYASNDPLQNWDGSMASLLAAMSGKKTLL
jgi:predicted transcriptional regulator